MSKHEETKPRRKFGDRKDGRRVKVSGLTTIMAHLMNNRADAEVCMLEKIDVTELMRYLDEKNASHPEYKTTFFHCMVTAVSRMLKERPKMNYFIAGRRVYERNYMAISFICKRRFQDNAEESLMTVNPRDEDTLDSISRHIIGDVIETRKSETSTDGIDHYIDSFAKLPRPILMLVFKVVRIMDFFGWMPWAVMKEDTNYSTVLLSNLGSIKCPSVYHHLNNYGTNSITATIGTIRKEPIVMKDGHIEIRDIVDIGATIDERIADGFYFARSWKLLRHIFANPQLLDLPLGEHSGYDYR